MKSFIFLPKRIINIIITRIVFARDKNGFYFRINGHGIRVINRETKLPTPYVRKGHIKETMVGKFGVAYLKPINKSY